MKQVARIRWQNRLAPFFPIRTVIKCNSWQSQSGQLIWVDLWVFSFYLFPTKFIRSVDERLCNNENKCVAQNVKGTREKKIRIAIALSKETRKVVCVFHLSCLQLTLISSFSFNFFFCCLSEFFFLPYKFIKKAEKKTRRSPHWMPSAPA